MNIPQHLSEELERGRVIPFIGAGVSQSVRKKGQPTPLFPNWKQLLELAADELVRAGKANDAAVVRNLPSASDPDFLDAARRAKNALSGAVWKQFISKHLDPDFEDIEPESLHLARCVWNIGSHLIITTNYDNTLRWACPDDLKEDLEEWSIEAPAEQAALLGHRHTKPIVWYLHGKISDSANLILAPEEYSRIYGAAPEYQSSIATLRSILSSYSLLFVGFSFTDNAITDLLREIDRTFRESTGPHYALVHRSEAQQLAAQDLPLEILVFDNFDDLPGTLLQLRACPLRGDEEQRTFEPVATVTTAEEHIGTPTQQFHENSSEVEQPHGEVPRFDAYSYPGTSKSKPDQLFAIAKPTVIVLLLLLTYFQMTEWGADEYFAAVVFLFPAVGYVLAVQILNWKKLREQRRLIHLGVHGRLKAPGYFRLSPYVEGDEYTRADGVHEEVLRWIQNTSESILYLTGRSGTGKSSMMHAWVMPKLLASDSPFCVVTVRTFSQPIQALKKKLTEPGVIWKRVPNHDVPARELLESACRYLGGKRLLVVLDQFEEFIVFNRPEVRVVFEDLLRSIERDPIPGLQLLFVLRSDYISQLAGLRLPPLKLHTSWWPVGEFTEAASRDFLLGSGLEIGEGRLEGAIREAEQIEEVKGQIRPITLNMIGVVLSRSLGIVDAGQIVWSYVHDVLRKIDLREESLAILQAMLSDKGTKYPRTERELAAETGVGQEIVQGCLVQLHNEGIVRQIDEEFHVWEISHDFVARVLDHTLVRMRFSWRSYLKKFLIFAAFAIWILIIYLYSAELRSDYAEESLREIGVEVGGEQAIFIPRRFKEEDFSEAARLLESVKRLKSISLNSIPINDVETMSRLSHVEKFDLSNTRLVNLMSLRHFKNLKQLDLKPTSLVDLAGIEEAVNLEGFYVTRGRFTDLTPLADLTKLRYLYLDYIESEEPLDLSPLRGLVELEHLMLTGTRVLSLEPLRNLPLKQLFLERGEVALRDFDNISQIRSLTHLYLAGSSVKTIDFVSSLSRLERLRISETDVVNLKPLEKLREFRSLQYLYLSDSNVSDLTPLSGLNLINLALQDLGQGVTGFESLNNMSELWLSGTSISPGDLAKLRSKIKTVHYTASVPIENEPVVEPGWHLSVYAAEESEAFVLDALACDDATGSLWVKGHRQGSGEGIRFGRIMRGRIEWRGEFDEIKVSSGTGIIVSPRNGHILVADEREGRIAAFDPYCYPQDSCAPLSTFFAIPNGLNILGNGTGHLKFLWLGKHLYFWNATDSALYRLRRHASDLEEDTSDIERVLWSDEKTRRGGHVNNQSNDLAFNNLTGRILLLEGPGKILEIDPETQLAATTDYLTGMSGKPNAIEFFDGNLFVLIDTRSLYFGMPGQRLELAGTFQSARDVEACRSEREGSRQIFIVDATQKAIFELRHDL